MSSERRILRPYLGIQKFEEAAQAFGIQIAAAEAVPGQKIRIPASVFRHDPLRIQPIERSLDEVRALARSACLQADLPPSSVDFVVIASSQYLKVLDIVHRSPLNDADAIPEKLVLTRDSCRALDLPAGGLDLRICFVLNEARPQVPLSPWRVGTWLGQAVFRLRTELGEIGFTPRLLTDEVRASKKIPKEAIRFVEVDWSMLIDGDLSGAVDLYVDETVLSRLNTNSNTPQARSFQRQLFIDVIAAIVRSSSAQLDTTSAAELASTSLGLLLDRAGEVHEKQPLSEQNERREGSFDDLKLRPEVFLAKIEAAAKPRDELLQAIDGASE